MYVLYKQIYVEYIYRYYKNISRFNLLEKTQPMLRRPGFSFGRPDGPGRIAALLRWAGDARWVRAERKPQGLSDRLQKFRQMLFPEHGLHRGVMPLRMRRGRHDYEFGARNLRDPRFQHAKLGRI